MALSSFTVTIITKSDSPFNVIPNAPIEIRERLANGSSGNLSLIFSDSAGLNPITQVGFAANSLGQATFFAAAADYNAVYDNNGTPVTIAVDVGVTGGILDKRIDRLNPATLAIAVDDSTLQVDDFLNVQEYFSGTGGGARWKVVLKSTVTTNTFWIVASTGNLTLALELIYNGKRLNIREHGAAEGIDSGPAIQATIDRTLTLFGVDGVNRTVYTPNGNFRIDAPLTASFGGSFPDFIGDGLKKSVWFAGDAMTTLLTLGVGAGTFVNRSFRYMTLSGGQLVDNIIDATEDRFFTIEMCEIRDFEVAGIISTKFAIRVINNIIVGKNTLGNTEVPTSIGVKLGVAGNALNDNFISLNYFHKVGVGVQIDVGAPDVRITDNDFDVCVRAGIYSKVTAQNMAIKGNYFERVGKTLDGANNTNPLLYPSDSTPMNGSIILHELNGAESSGYENLSVDDNNTFRNCNSNEIMTFSNVFTASIKNNHVDDDFSSYTNFVKFIGEGTGFVNQRARKVVIEGQPEGITRFVDWALKAGNDPYRGFLHGLVIRPVSKAGTLYEGLVLINDPTTFKNASQTINTSQYGMGFRYEFVSPRFTNILTIDITENPQLIGRFIRVIGATKSQSATPGGMRVQTVHDGVAQTDSDHSFTFQSATPNYQFYLSIIVYVPTTLTTSWGIELFQVPNETIDLVGFSVFDAAINVDEVAVVKQFYS